MSKNSSVKPVQTLAAVMAEVKDGTVVAFNQTETALANLRTQYGDVALFDIRTKEGMKAAKAGRKEIANFRTALEAKRKDLKAPILECGRIIDAEAKRITDELLKLETPLDKHITDAEKLEEARINAIKNRIDKLKGTPAQLIGVELANLRKVHTKISAIKTSEFEEFEQEAISAIDGVFLTLNALIASAEQTEKANKEIEELRAKLAQAKAVEDRRLAEEKAIADAKQLADENSEQPEKVETSTTAHIKEVKSPASVKGCDEMAAISTPEFNAEFDEVFKEPAPAAPATVQSEFQRGLELAIKIYVNCQRNGQDFVKTVQQFIDTDKENSAKAA